ncbi:peptidase associated/transthyretin-like domain-containing protein [Pedobacter paludis]|uniref:Rhamnogalacturonan lyase domain-containing protein n=1 Tax=Pedobacter paludis TaxID=2203212 RepID=A0A317F586_9SPHI|nr:hypothetical protein [Pedobacter paludis]PWS33207.1 hypothetical protein DF947_00795 [Pedobacter paludis]
MAKSKKIFFTFLAGLLWVVTAKAQYVEPNEFKSPVELIFPNQKFDSSAAKDALAKGTATLTGILGQDKPSGLGESFKKIYLFPATPYFKEWYDLKKKGAQVKKGKIKIAAIDSTAARYSYWCQTNIEGKFTFPNLKPGKYIMLVTLDRVASRTSDKYQGSAYDNYGGQADYYSTQTHNTFYKEDFMKEVEIPASENVVTVKWKTK